jgi:hypothetical protein
MPCPTLEVISSPRQWHPKPVALAHAASQSLMMWLVIQLYDDDSRTSTVLRLINTFLDHGASIDVDSAVFFVGQEKMRLGLCPGWPIRCSNKARLIYKAKLSFLLHLALLSINSAFSEDGTTNKPLPPCELTQGLLSRVGKGELQHYPEVLGYIFCTPRGDPEELDLYKVKGVEDSSRIGSLLVRYLWGMPRGIISYHLEQKLWDELYDNNMKDGFDRIPIKDLRANLVEAGLLVSLEECWKDILSFRVTK